MRGIDLDGGDEIGKLCHQFVVQTGFQNQNLVFRSQNLLFVLFQFLRDVSFCIDQCLLAYPVGRNLVFMCISYLDVIAEHVVVGYFQAGDARQFTFALLYLQQIILARVSNVAQFVQLLIDSVGNHSSLVDQQRRIIVYFLGNLVADGSAEVQLFSYFSQAFVVGIQTGILDRLYRL